MTQVHTRDGIFGPGGYGGGVFDGSNMGFGGMGRFEQAAAGIGAVSWMGPSDPKVVLLQQALNKELSARGYKAIGTDGVLGPGTCGAVAWLGSLTDVNFDANPNLKYVTLTYGLDPDDPTSVPGPSLCKTFTYPTKVGGTVFVPKSTYNNALPWNVQSALTLTVQKDINNDLVNHGYLPVDESGVLDATTCGAMQLAKTAWGMDYLSAYGGNCAEFTPPTLKPVPVVAPAPPPTPAVTPHPVQKASMGGWVVGGLLAAAVVAGVVASKKKR